MSMIREQACATRYGSERPQTCLAGDQENDQELVFDCVYWLNAGKDLTGHHPRRRNKTDRRHTVHGRHETCSQRVPYSGEHSLIPGAAQCETGFYGRSFADQAIGQRVQTQAYTCHGVAQHHAQQGQRIVRMIAGIRAQLRQ